MGVETGSGRTSALQTGTAVEAERPAARYEQELAAWDAVHIATADGRV